MTIIKYGSTLLILLLFSQFSSAQELLKISRSDSEALFLQANLSLIAEKLNISQAEAKVMQAKLWPNPNLTIDQVNLWATKAQTGGQEVIPALGKFLGSNQQAGFQIEQLIQTAGKRKKLMALEQVSVDKSKQYFEDLLRNLKVEFRNKLTQLQYLQLSKSIYEKQFGSIQLLAKAYKNQVTLGNYTKGEYIRIKALELEIAQEINALTEDLNDSQKELKLFMRLPVNTSIEITGEGYTKETSQIALLNLNDLIEKAKQNRPDYKLANLEQTYFDKLYRYEKAQRVPDVTFSGAYDRGGSAMLNFFGFGISADLPVFNRNQGNIAYAKIGKEQAKVQFEQMDLTVETEIELAFKNLNNAVAFYKQIEPDYEKTLDDLLDNYLKNFSSRRISLLEYLDFQDAYFENKKIILEAGKAINEKVEELNYKTGLDLIK
ncbi:cobalt-zinc-cadmium efflux system outer membrane protein [Flavobacterium sp. 28A]|uniref:TolC family protein n=1 Tax=Flavobacterium sp. 28A TaxID=2735895 RepID=UPI00156D94F7|nr:TolC family protein [Flavobacterium sp. 28A]NRT16842.1 cobalt-zinc-cadmium efflux system outer membrane protein [Flavobacterium sp. 28A]